MTRQFQSYIDGRWVAGDDLAPDENPSDLSSPVGEAGRVDAATVREAIAAANAAQSAWAASTPQQRADALDAVGSEILARKQELGALLASEEGKTLPESIAEAARAGQIFKFFAGEALRIPGETLASTRPGVNVEDHPRAGRHGRHHRAVEFPAGDPGVEDRAGAGLRQHGGVQARGDRARLRLGAGRDPQPRRPAQWRVQPGARQRQHGRPGAGRRARHRCAELHRLGADRQPAAQAGRRARG